MFYLISIHAHDIHTRACIILHTQEICAHNVLSLARIVQTRACIYTSHANLSVRARANGDGVRVHVRVRVGVCVVCVHVRI